MEHHTKCKLLNNLTVLNKLDRSLIYQIVSILSTPMLRSDFCDYSDGYGVVKERISVTGTDNGSKRYRKLTFKYNELIRSCI